MSEIKDGGPAFPRTGGQVAGPNAPEWVPPQEGMSRHDWFRGHAMALAHADYAKGVSDRDLKEMFGGRSGLTRYEIIAGIASLYADAML